MPRQEALPQRQSSSVISVPSHFAQAAVAETGVRFLLNDLKRIELLTLAELLYSGVNQEIGDIVGQSATEQEFH